MITTEEIVYIDLDTTCRGFMAFDNTHTDPRPCVMVVPDWTGRGDAACKKAEQLAELGFVGFAVDMYGEARLGHTLEEKQALFSSVMSDRRIVARRMLAVLQAVSVRPEVDRTKIVAMGYCFGGLCALDLARTGVSIAGAISLHGILTAPTQAMAETIKAAILVLHGYDDPMVPPEQVNAFADEMTKKRADWQVHMYGHTQHAFTNPEAHDAAMGLQYSPTADRRSWQSVCFFLNELLGKNGQ